MGASAHARHASPVVSLAFRRLALAAGLIVWSLPVFSWPTTSEWLPVLRGGTYIQDDNGDTQGSRNVVSDSTHAALYIFNDGTYVHFRLRLDKDPSGTGGQGLLESFGWGVEFDTNLIATDFEWLIMVDGIAKNENISLLQNTVQGTINDPGDQTEVLSTSVSLFGNHQVLVADSAFNGDTDYFLDWRFPYATLKFYTGLTDSSPLRIFPGASPSANTLTENGGDLAGASDLVAGFSDFITPFGTSPTTGTVMFVADLTGAGDVTTITAGDTVYIRVDDGDQNHNPTQPDTVIVHVSSAVGDSEQVVLTETGANTGVFTGSVPSLTDTVTTNDGTLQVTPGTLVTVTYVDAIDAQLHQNQSRTDTLTVRGPQMLLEKSVDKTAAAPGETVTYKVHYRNLGAAAATTVIISDSIPAYTSYIPGSLRIGAASATYDTATPKTDSDADGDGAQTTTGGVVFIIGNVAPNDGVADAGDDEGVVYFQVKVN